VTGDEAEDAVTIRRFVSLQMPLNSAWYSETNGG